MSHINELLPKNIALEELSSGQQTGPKNVVPYLITSIGHGAGADPSFLAVSLQVT